MCLVLLAALLVALYFLNDARDAHNALMLELLDRGAVSPEPSERWQQIGEQFAAEEQVWRQAADVQQSARQAMREAALAADRPPPPRPPRIVVQPTTWGAAGVRHGWGSPGLSAYRVRPRATSSPTVQAVALMPAAGLAAEDVQRVVRERWS